MCERVDFSKDNPFEIYEALEAILKEKKGLGLAAPQIGINKQAFIFGNPDIGDFYAAFNPKIVFYSEETTNMEEGCLTFPGLIAKVERSKEIKARFTSLANETKTVTMTGMTARIFQHEYDHLQGKLFFDDLSKMKREMIMKRCYKKYGIRYSI